MKRTRILLPLSLGGLLSLGTALVGGCGSDSTSTNDGGSKTDGTSSGGSGSSSGGGSGSSSGSSSGGSSGSSSGSSSGGSSGSSSGGSSGGTADAGNCPLASMCPTCMGTQVCCATRCTPATPPANGQAKGATTACVDPAACMGGVDVGIIACTATSCPAGSICCGPQAVTNQYGTSCVVGTTCTNTTTQSKVCLTDADCAGQPGAPGTPPRTACGIGGSSAGVFRNCRPPPAPVDAGMPEGGGTPEGGTEGGGDAAPMDAAMTDAPTGG
jgi:hypothetical protein